MDDGFSRRVLLQGLDPGAKVDVEGKSVEHKRRDGFDARPLGFSDPVFLIAEMNNLHIELLWIEGSGDGLLGFDADWAACVVEGDSVFHDVEWMVYWIGVLISIRTDE